MHPDPSDLAKGTRPKIKLVVRGNIRACSRARALDYPRKSEGLVTV